MSAWPRASLAGSTVGLAWVVAALGGFLIGRTPVSDLDLGLMIAAAWAMISVIRVLAAWEVNRE